MPSAPAFSTPWSSWGSVVAVNTRSFVALPDSASRRISPSPPPSEARCRSTTATSGAVSSTSSAPVSAVPATPVTFQPSRVSVSRRKMRSAPWSSTIATVWVSPVVMGRLILRCSAEDLADAHGRVDRALGDGRRALVRVAHPVGTVLAHGEAQRPLALAVDLGLAEDPEPLAGLALGDRDGHAATGRGLTERAAQLVARAGPVQRRDAGQVERGQQRQRDGRAPRRVVVAVLRPCDDEVVAGLTQADQLHLAGRGVHVAGADRARDRAVRGQHAALGVADLVRARARVAAEAEQL